MDILLQMQKVSGEGTKAANTEKGNDVAEEAKKNIINLIGLTGPYTAMRQKMAQADAKYAEERMHMEDEISRYSVEDWAKKEKLQEEAGKDEAEHVLKMALLKVASEREGGLLRMAQRRMSLSELMDLELGWSAQEYSAKKEALKTELAAIAESDKDKVNRKLALNNKLLELDKQYENQTQGIEDQAQKKQLALVQSSVSRMQQAYAQGFSSVIMGKQSFGQMMQALTRRWHPRPFRT